MSAAIFVWRFKVIFKLERICIGLMPVSACYGFIPMSLLKNIVTRLAQNKIEKVDLKKYSAFNGLYLNYKIITGRHIDYQKNSLKIWARLFKTRCR